MRTMVNSAQGAQRPMAERFFGILSQHLAGLAEAGAFAAAPDPDLWSSIAAAGKGSLSEAVATAAAALGQNWHDANLDGLSLVSAQAALRQKIWSLCALYASDEEAEVFRTVGLVDKWLDSISVAAMGEVQRLETAAIESRSNRLAGPVLLDPGDEASVEGITPGQDEEIDRLLAEVAELESRRDALNEEIGSLINVVREQS